MDWHSGEIAIHKLTHNLRDDNPTTPFLTPRAASMASRYSLMALGTLDSTDQPWCTVWGTGEPPLAQAVAQSVLGIKSVVDGSFDPVVQELFGGKMDGEVVREDEPGHMVSALSIHLEERGRVKLYGRMVAGAASTLPDTPKPSSDSEGTAAEVQLVLKIEQSLGNCPKYLNKKKIISNTPSPRLISTSSILDPEAIDLIHRADLLFIASAHEHEDMDLNHRGGPAGFIRVSNPPPISSDNDAASQAGSVIVWPEYSGNNLYQTLGNLVSTPRAGICIPDFESADVLYLTGTTEVLVGDDAAGVIAKSNLAVKLTVTGSRYVKNGLPFKGINIDDGSEGRSPYNPRVRYLRSEKADEVSASGTATTATLIEKKVLTPTVSRYRFSLSPNPPEGAPLFKAGQYVALDFSQDMNMGYAHMNDNDPTSLNDDYIRTFTVSSTPGLGLHGEEFEITIRNVGAVTKFLGWQRVGFEVGVGGFGGDFMMVDCKGGKAFIAGGIGITPLLPQITELETCFEDGSFRVLWSLGLRDIRLLERVIEDFPVLTSSMTVFLTGDESQLSNTEKESLQNVMGLGIDIKRRRMQKEDVQQVDKLVDECFLCTAPGMRKQVQEWIPEREIIFENFDY